MESTTTMSHENDLNLKATELRLGLPGTDGLENAKNNNKRALQDSTKTNFDTKEAPPASKAQIVGWPPVRSCMKNNFQAKKSELESAMYVKVCMDGAPYLRKIDLKVYNGYPQLLKALGDMFKLKFGEYSEREGYNSSEFAPAYEDKDGDLMLVGDVPFNMFISICKRLRIMKASEAKGLGFSI